jgi:HK97 family phage major capsid protein
MRTDGVLKAAASLPWAIMPDKLDAIFDVLEFHAEGLKLSKEEIRARVGVEAKSGTPAVNRGSVAVLPLYGVLSQRMNMMSEMSGGTSTEQFGAQLDALIENPQVSAIVLDIDSPGGSVFGVPEVATRIRAARDVKPVYAVANGTMASAAYYLGAQATEVIASPSSLVGSIGVYMVHLDDTGELDQLGLKRTVVSAGANKAEGIGPLTPDARAHLQSIVDDAYAMMLNDVAQGRGVSPQTIEQSYGQGRVFSAQQSKAAGLVDRIATLDDVVNELITAKKATTRIRAAADPPALRLHQIAPAAALLSGGSVSGPFVLEIEPDLLAAAPRRELPPGRIEAGYPAAHAAFTPSTAAPKAQEHTVETPNTANPTNTGAAPSAVDAIAALEKANARNARAEAIGQLCTLAGATLADANAFAASDKTVEQVRQELAARASQPKPIAGLTSVVDREAGKPFGTLGDQLVAIAQYGMGGSLDKRLMGVQAAATGAGANVPSDGSFLIQQDFVVDLTKDAFNEGQLAADCSSTEVSASSDGLRVAYVDETSRATGSRWGGIQIYRGAEADSATAKKPKIGEWETRVYDLIGLAYMTERLLLDAAAMQSVFSQGFASEFAFVVDDEIVRGTGAGQCLGIVNSPALVTVTKETGQLAATVVAENISKMWARLMPRAKAGASWYINQEVEQQLQFMQIGTGVSAQLVYMPPGGFSGQKYGTIYGAPVKVVEQCSAPGTVGDIILANLRQAYQLVTKGGLQAMDSIHVRFINNERTFRWVSRVGGAPRLKSALTPYKGSASATLSDHVVLGTR